MIAWWHRGLKSEPPVAHERPSKYRRYEFRMSAYPSMEDREQTFTDAQVVALGVAGKEFLDRLDLLGVKCGGEWGGREW